MFLGPSSSPTSFPEAKFEKALCSVCTESLIELLVLAFPSVDIDSGYYTVKFDSLLLKEAVVEGDSIIPPLRNEDGASSAESDEDSVDDSGYAKGERVVRV